MCSGPDIITQCLRNMPFRSALRWYCLFVGVMKCVEYVFLNYTFLALLMPRQHPLRCLYVATFYPDSPRKMPNLTPTSPQGTLQTTVSSTKPMILTPHNSLFSTHPSDRTVRGKFPVHLRLLTRRSMGDNMDNIRIGCACWFLRFGHTGFQGQTPSWPCS